MRTLKKHFSQDNLKRKINRIKDSDMAIKALTSSGWHEEKAVYDQFQTYIKNDLDMLQEQCMENMKREYLAELK